MVPYQSKEHYPRFLADEQGEMRKRRREVYTDGDAEFQAWRTHYAKQFEKDVQLSWLNERIDAIVRFENLMMNWELRTVEEFRAVFKLLEENNVFNQPIPPLWETAAGVIDGRKTVHPTSEPDDVGSEEES